MPIHRRLPKRGFRNTMFQLKLNEVNLGDVQKAIDAGTIDAKAAIDSAALVKAGLMRRAKDGVRLLGSGEIKAKAAFVVYGASKPAIAAVEKAGGSVTILAPKKEAPAEPKGKNARFAAGLDKPKIVESAPAPKAEGKAKADKEEKPKADKKGEGKGAE